MAIVRWILQKCTPGQSVLDDGSLNQNICTHKNAAAVHAMSHGVLLRMTMNFSMRTYSYSRLSLCLGFYLQNVMFSASPGCIASQINWQIHDDISTNKCHSKLNHMLPTNELNSVLIWHIKEAYYLPFQSTWKRKVHRLSTKTLQSNGVNYLWVEVL